MRLLQPTADIHQMLDIELNRPRFSRRSFARCIYGVFGGALCVLGASIATVPIAAFGFALVFTKFLVAVLLFAAGILVARSGFQPVDSELHFDPKFGEFILVPVDEDLRGAQCILSVDRTNVDVSGRHLRVVTDTLGTDISIALSDAEDALRVSKTCDIPKIAA